MLPDDEADLRWYFVEARGDCGVRSCLGPQLEMLRQGTLPGKNERRVSADINEYVAMAGDRANKVAARLRRCSERSQLVLELHHGVDGQLGSAGVSLALACWTPTARSGYKAASSAMRGRKIDTARSRALATSRMWLLWISMQAQKRDGEAAQAILDKVLNEAIAALNAAHADYEASR